MNHGSLFSGIGGFDLAAEWIGWTNKFHCEWNPFCQKVLKHYWPMAESYEDITKTDFSIWRGRINIITGGFPCQPYSAAGKRLGKEDDRHLWPEMLRTIHEIQPSYVVGENVRGLTNWNGGLVFDEVQADLESEGYEVLPFLLPACGVNAPHRRDRIWFIAYSASNRRIRSGQGIEIEKGLQQRSKSNWKLARRPEGLRLQGNVTNSGNEGLQGGTDDGYTGESRKIKNKLFTRLLRSDFKEFPTQSPICDGDDGFSGKLDSITFSKWRSESIKAGGNAIVPHVAFNVFKAIEEYEKIHLHT